MAIAQPLVTQFTIVGKLEDLTTKSKDCIKSLQLVAESGEYWIKVAKEIRRNLASNLQPGCFVKVSGMCKHEIHKGKVKYKAYRVELLQKPTKKEQVLSHTPVATKPKAKVLFCQKSKCWKNGGKTACQLLKKELESKGISDRVEVKTVGCLKKCKQAPNMVLMPDKARYSKISPKQMSGLVKKHLLADS